jgi:hypothetical protein
MRVGVSAAVRRPRAAARGGVRGDGRRVLSDARHAFCGRRACVCGAGDIPGLGGGGRHEAQRPRTCVGSPRAGVDAATVASASGCARVRPRDGAGAGCGRRGAGGGPRAHAGARDHLRDGAGPSCGVRRRGRAEPASARWHPAAARSREWLDRRMQERGCGSGSGSGSGMQGFGMEGCRDGGIPPACSLSYNSVARPARRRGRPPALGVSPAGWSSNPAPARPRVAAPG